MPEGGRLTVETGNARLDPDYAAEHAEVKPGQYVMIAVSDTGVGMDRETAREAFAPFFTTKAVGKGSGLGLSMVYGFVKQSGGHVKIYSEPGKGTTVRMYLPRADAGEDADGPAPDGAAEAASGRRGLILVVEDDPAVLRYVERALRALGYETDVALNGAYAAALLERRAYDLLLTDVVLPGEMTGRKLADMAARVRPGMPVLFMSGYTENAIVHHGRLDPGVELISKPFTREQLAKRLTALLGR
jgi:CheY-like chemotaxis protein